MTNPSKSPPSCAFLGGEYFFYCGSSRQIGEPYNRSNFSARLFSGKLGLHTHKIDFTHRPKMLGSIGSVASPALDEHCLRHVMTRTSVFV